MKKNVTFKLAASTLVLGLTVVGCAPAANNFAAGTASSRVPEVSESAAAKHAARAKAAVKRNDIPAALAATELAVAGSPRDLGYRVLLGDLYLKSGRFLSAEQAFLDVLALDPSNSRGTLSLALALIAQNKSAEAVERLAAVAETAPGDAGLAYALAGQPQRAIELLESAARAPGADGRVRQNLALAYAISGDWQKARVTASQDLASDEVSARMQQWADFANPNTAHLKVASLLGTTPVEDAGQPVHLALAPADPDQPVFAEADAPAPVAEAEPAVILAEATAPAREAPVAPVASERTTDTFAYAPPEHGDVFAAAQPASIDLVDVPASAAEQPVRTIDTVQFAAAVDTLVKAPEPILAAVAPKAKVAPAPVRAFVPQKAVKKTGPGRFVVQIGAYRNAAQVEQAWAQAIRRYRFAREPMSTTVNIPGKGTFYRLAIAGFSTPVEAGKRCSQIRSQGGTCFVRATAGDAPVQWASRYSRRA